MASWDRRPVATLLPQHCLEELLRNQLWILVGCFMMFHDVSWFFEIGSPFHIHKLDRNKSRHLSGSYLSYLLWLCYTRTISRVEDRLSGGCSQAKHKKRPKWPKDLRVLRCETLRDSAKLLLMLSSHFGVLVHRKGTSTHRHHFHVDTLWGGAQHPRPGRVHYLYLFIKIYHYVTLLQPHRFV